jgi:hypothetical protein
VSKPPYFVKGITVERENTVLLAKMKNYEKNENWMEAEEQQRLFGHARPGRSASSAESSSRSTR